MIEVRLTRALLKQITEDLHRPHPFAAERVGFVFGKLGSLGNGDQAVLLTRYMSLPDDHYERNDKVGAFIGEKAMAEAMNQVFQSRNEREGIFHIHLHEHRGPTGVSEVDQQDVPRMIPNFANVSRNAAHGFIILSEDHGLAWVRTPDNRTLVEVPRIVVSGAPLAIYQARRAW